MNVNNNLVSIIVPVFNSENTIEKCINSLISQTYKNIEIIIVDDGSTDNSFKICEKMKKQDLRITVLQQKNSGVSAARNKGIQIAKGKYITFVDSDDTISRNFIEDFELNKYDNEKKILYKSAIKLVKQDRIENLDDMNNNGNELSVEDFKTKLISNEINGYSWGYIYITDIVKSILFEEKISFMEDLVFLLHYISFVDTIKTVDTSIYYYYVNFNGITQSKKINCKNIISLNLAIDTVKKIINYDNKSEKILDKRKCKLIESEIGRLENYNAIDALLANEEIIAILKNMIKNKNVSIFYKIYFSIILNDRYVLFKIYIFIRKHLKKIKEALT